MAARRPCTPDAHRPSSGPAVARTRRRGRATFPVFFLAAASVLILAVACSRVVRHRVLTFLYDGVPPLHAELAHYEPLLADPLAATGDDATGDMVAARTRSYSHPAYQRNLCGACHDGEGGRVGLTAREGLCQTCHPDKPARKKFVHGPVAVNGCLACHHYHKAPYPKVLIADAQALCFSCHVMEELRTDEHHATLEQRRCIDCHDAHGGDDRYFLLPGVAKEVSRDDPLIQEQEH